MMGKKKLHAIRAEVRQELKATGTDLLRWLEQEIGKRQTKQPPDNREAETLLWVREALSGDAKPARRRTSKRLSKG